LLLQTSVDFSGKQTSSKAATILFLHHHPRTHGTLFTPPHHQLPKPRLHLQHHPPHRSRLLIQRHHCHCRRPTWETSHLAEMALLRRGIQDPDGFDHWEKQKTGMQSVDMHGSGGWIMPLERCLGMRHRGSSTSTPLSSLEKRPTLPLRPWCA
jgi:hypothetical protein